MPVLNVAVETFEFEVVDAPAAVSVEYVCGALAGLGRWGGGEVARGGGGGEVARGGEGRREG